MHPVVMLVQIPEITLAQYFAAFLPGLCMLILGILVVSLLYKILSGRTDRFLWVLAASGVSLTFVILVSAGALTNVQNERSANLWQALQTQYRVKIVSPETSQQTLLPDKDNLVPVTVLHEGEEISAGVISSDKTIALVRIEEDGRTVPFNNSGQD